MKNLGNSPRIVVTESGFDDIGSVLDSLGSAFRYRVISFADLNDASSLRDCDVCFINCSDACQNEDCLDSECADDTELPGNLDSYPLHLSRFVAGGGSLYVSDWAGECVRLAFPGVMQFDQAGQVQEMVCRTVDPGLREVIGASIDVHFESPDWWRIIDRSEIVRVYLESPEGMPIVAGFKHGQGQVLFTSFHNGAQVSELERRLLEYLVLRPVLARAVTGAQRIIEAERCTPGREVVGTLSRSSNTRAFTFDASGVGDALFLLHWNGSTPLRMSVSDPAGRTVYDQSGPAPLRFTAPATRGPWRCTVLGASLPHDNFPFVLTIATRNQGGAPLPPHVSPQIPGQAPKPSAAPPAPMQPWELSLVIDCSARSADFAPATGNGLSALLRALRAMPVTTVAPAVAVVPWRSGDLGGVTRSPLASLGPVNLACSGQLSARACADWLARAMQARPASASGKPMVVLVLASEPSDSAAGGLQAIRQLAGPEKANVIAVGLGPMVQGSTLRAIAPLALKVESGSSAETTACFEWIAELARGSIRALEGKGSAFTAPPLPAGVVKV